MENIALLRHCNSIGVNQEKFKKCNIEKMGDKYVFVLSKDNVPKSKSLLPLDIDIASQPDIILIMSVDDSGNYCFEETEKTVRVLNV